MKCKPCKGTGRRIFYAGNSFVSCPSCNGTGEVKECRYPKTPCRCGEHKPSPDRMEEIVENFIFDHRSLDGAGLLASDYATSEKQEHEYETEQFEDIIKLIKIIKAEALRMSEEIIKNMPDYRYEEISPIEECKFIRKDEIRQRLGEIFSA